MRLLYCNRYSRTRLSKSASDKEIMIVRGIAVCIARGGCTTSPPTISQLAYIAIRHNTAIQVRRYGRRTKASPKIPDIQEYRFTRYSTVGPIRCVESHVWFVNQARAQKAICCDAYHHTGSPSLASDPRRRMTIGRKQPFQTSKINVVCEAYMLSAEVETLNVVSGC